MSSLLDIVNSLLNDCGFDKTSYSLSEHDKQLIVEFNNFAAGQYLLQVAKEKKYNDTLVGQMHSQNGRHKVTFFSW